MTLEEMNNFTVPVHISQYGKTLAKQGPMEQELSCTVQPLL